LLARRRRLPPIPLFLAADHHRALLRSAPQRDALRKALHEQQQQIAGAEQMRVECRDTLKELLDERAQLEAEHAAATAQAQQATALREALAAAEAARRAAEGAGAQAVARLAAAPPDLKAATAALAEVKRRHAADAERCGLLVERVQQQALQIERLGGGAGHEVHPVYE